MFKNKKLLFGLIGGALVLALVAGGAAVASTTIARAQENPMQRAANLPLSNIAQQVIGGEFGHDGSFPSGDRMPGKGEENATYLAEALGISVEELQAATQAASLKAIDVAVEEGLLTEEQAQALKERAEGDLAKGFKFKGFKPGDENGIDFEALLAEELDISVEELQAAQEQAKEAALQAAVESGKLTQEQADMMNAQMALKDYLDYDKLFEQAMGMSVEEAQTAMQEAYEAAIQQAVEDGVITQEQAEQILSEKANFGAGGMFPGFKSGGFDRGGRGHGGRGGHGGFDNFPGNEPSIAPEGES